MTNNINLRRVICFVSISLQRSQTLACHIKLCPDTVWQHVCRVKYYQKYINPR